MVEYILGNYLVESGKITFPQLEDVIARLDETRVRMGLIAVAEGMMTAAQADEVNRLQAVMDKRFGDIAVEKGYLTEEQISNLLKRQGNTYLAFAQTLVNAGLLDMMHLEEVMDGLQKANGFTKSEMDDLRSNEPERIVPLFLPNEAMGFVDLAGMLVRTLIRHADRHVYIGKAGLEEEALVSNASFQRLADLTMPVAGYRELEAGIVEVDGGMARLATAFCKEEELLDGEDALDGAGELLNCVNGLYARTLSRSGIDSELMPPEFVGSGQDRKLYNVCRIPVYTAGFRADFVIMGKK